MQVPTVKTSKPFESGLFDEKFSRLFRKNFVLKKLMTNLDKYHNPLLSSFLKKVIQ